MKGAVTTGAGAMAAQEGMKRKSPAAKVTEEAPETAEAPVASDGSLEDLGLSTRVVNTLTHAGLRTVQDLLDKLDQGEKIEGIGDKSLERIHKRLAEKSFRLPEGKEAEVEQERQAPSETEKAKAEAERALAEARKAMEAEAENREPPPAAPGEKAEQQPVSFNVRVTVDEQGKPLRTEIQPVTRDRKAGKYLGLNGQELAAYMERYISALVTPEPTIAPVPPPARVEAPMLEPLGPAISLTVSDVRVFRAGVPGVRALISSSGEAFVVEARFQLHGPEALSLTAQESAFQVQVYAREVTSGTSTLLTTQRVSLVEGVLKYTAQMQLPGLSPGRYRPLTVVRLLNMLGHREGPIVHVAGVQPSVNPAALLEVPLYQ